MYFDIEKDLKLCAEKVTEALGSCYPVDPVSAEIFEAEKYSLLVGGKRTCKGDRGILHEEYHSRHDSLS